MYKNNAHNNFDALSDEQLKERISKLGEMLNVFESRDGADDYIVVSYRDALQALKDELHKREESRVEPKDEEGENSDPFSSLLRNFKKANSRSAPVWLQTISWIAWAGLALVSTIQSIWPGLFAHV